MTQSKIILLSCGSYNPPTNMHLRMFEIARDNLNRLGRFHVIGGIVSPVHDNYGKKELISSTHRCALARLALQDSDWIHLSDWECNQDGWLPTRQVLQYHQNKINSYLQSNENSGNKRSVNSDVPQWIQQAQKNCANNSSVRVKLLCGADLLESFGTPGLWKDCDIESIVGDHGLAVITRAGSDPLRFIYESDVLTKYQNNISIITEWIVNEVSSTKIRRSLRRGESVKYLLANQVIDYIKNTGLYSSFDNKYDGSSFLLTPSPSDVIMSAIDVPDNNTGNYHRQNNRLGVQEAVLKRARPGLAVPHRKVTVASCCGCSSTGIVGGGLVGIGVIGGSCASSSGTSSSISTNCICNCNHGHIAARINSPSFDEGLEEVVEELEYNGDETDLPTTSTANTTAAAVLINERGGDTSVGETRVEIQISEDGQIQVISDKETTV